LEGGRFGGQVLTEAEQNRLIVENMLLVEFCAQEFRDKGVDFEELVAAGREGLVKAARTFDPTLGFKFSTWAVNKISVEIHTFCRSHEKAWFLKKDLAAEPRKGLSPLDPLPPLDSNSIERLYEWSGWRGANAKAIVEHWDELGATAQELRDMFVEIVNKQLPLAELMQVQRKLIKWAFMDRISIKQAARDARVSYWRAVRLLKKALRILHAEITKADKNRSCAVA
jgi:RNA polymerase sigma factor (sigma-70 family)